MFSKVNVRTLGVIENASGFICPDCGSEHDIFGSGGGAKIARELELDVLGASRSSPASAPAATPACRSPRRSTRAARTRGPPRRSARWPARWPGA